MIQELYRPAHPDEAGQIGALLDLYFALTSESGTWSFEEMADWQREAGPQAAEADQVPDRPGEWPAVGGESGLTPFFR